MGPDLCLEELTWSFPSGQEPFLNIPHLTLESGQLTAVVGPSGAGKSTLLFLLAGLEVPTRGRLLWGGHDMAADKPRARDLWRRRNLGLVFQDFQLIPELTALENVLLPLTFGRFRVSTSERNRARLLLDQMGVGRAGARASTLSRGEMQRTALARALLSEPPILLADEPTASLDAQNEVAVVDLLTAYCRDKGATVVVSTHQAALRDRADRRIGLDHGRFVEAVP
jgi:putative ABC transport system ATP-binding protein